MKAPIRTFLAAIGALALISSLSGCIFVERGGHGGGRCLAPVEQTICAGPAWGHGGR